MPTDTQQTGGQPPNLLGALIQRFGIGTALAILRLFDPNSSTAAKAFAGGRIGATGLQVGGRLAGSPGVAGFGRGLGTALGIAGTGYGISQIAGNPNLSTKQKAGHSAGEAANLIASMFVPYYGLGVAARAGNQALARSGSPQISGAAKGAAGQATPVEGLLSVMQGDASPKSAFRTMGKRINENPWTAFADPVSGTILGALGIGQHKPTQGTQFRGGLKRVLGGLGVTGIKNWKPDDFTTDMFNAYTDRPARDSATRIGELLAARSSKPGAYGIQAQNILLQNLQPQQIMDLAKRLGL